MMALRRLCQPISSAHVSGRGRAFNRRNRRWRREEIDEGLRGLCLLRVRRNPDGEDRHALDLVWQWTNVVDARDRKELADLLKANLRVAPRHDGADTLADNAPGLRRQLLGDSESRKELGRKIRPRWRSPNTQSTWPARACAPAHRRS